MVAELASSVENENGGIDVWLPSPASIPNGTSAIEERDLLVRQCFPAAHAYQGEGANQLILVAHVRRCAPERARAAGDHLGPIDRQNGLQPRVEGAGHLERGSRLL